MRSGIRNGVVEGEPGVFPEPVARVMRGIGHLFGRGRRGRRSEPATGDPGPRGPGPDDPVDVSELDPKRPGRSPEA